MKDKEDISNLSAFAIYNQLIPGVKSYTEENSESNSKKRKRKKKNKSGADLEKVPESTTSVTLKSSLKNAKDVKQKPEVQDIETVSKDTQSTKKKRKRKKNKDRVENGEISNSLSPSSPKIAKIDPIVKSKSQNDLPLLLPNPLAGAGPPKQKKKGKSALLKIIRKENEDIEEVLAVDEEPLPPKGRKKKRQKALIDVPEFEAQVNDNGIENDYVDSNSIASLFTSKPIWDSIEHGKSLLEWLIFPTSVDTFMSEYWEKKPLHIKRSEMGAASTDYYKWILSSERIDDILRRNVLKYQKNIDITSFSKSNNVRETQSDDLEGRARPAVVWDYYNNGCSIRILNPQTYIKQLWRLNASLQEWFGSFVGANVYLTPPDSQGFAPHYDDIEAFIIQVEGKKHWKLYKPRSKNEELPRFSSNNFSEEKDNLGKPILDVVVEEGDLLYFPRGTIHQAMASEDVHSLHITLSCHQKNSWGDLLKEHLNNVVDKAMASDVEFRRGLPPDYLSYMGIAHQDSHDNDIREKRKKFGKTVKRLMDKLSTNAADFAADQMGKKFVWDSLPPYLSSKEKAVTVNEDGEFIQFGTVFNRCEMDPDVEVKLVRKNCIRLVVEEGAVRLYFTTENPLVYHEEEAQYLELSAKTAPAVQYLISSYPEYVKIDDLPISADDVSEKVQVAADLWERGLLMTRTPLETADGDGEFDSEDAESIGKESDEELGSDLEEVEDMDEDNFFGESDDSDDDDDGDDDEEEDMDSYFNENDSNEDSDEDEELPVPILVKKKKGKK